LWTGQQWEVTRILEEAKLGTRDGASERVHVPERGLGKGVQHAMYDHRGYADIAQSIAKI